MKNNEASLGYALHDLGEGCVTLRNFDRHDASPAALDDVHRPLLPPAKPRTGRNAQCVRRLVDADLGEYAKFVTEPEIDAAKAWTSISPLR